MIPIAHPQLGDEERAAVLRVLDSGQLAQGAVVAELEQAFAARCGVNHAVALSSGTAALHALFLAYGLGSGDEVITSAFTFIASANAALFVGARPVFVDVDPATFCLDPAQVEAAVTPRTRAILAVHLYGHPADMNRLRAVAERRGLLLIEDACQAHGAMLNAKPVGGLADAAVFSLYPTKNMTAGEGGLITTNDDGIAERARLIRNHGQSARYRHDVLGYNFRLTDLHAAIGLAQLHRLDEFNAARRQKAAALTRGLRDLESVILPTEQPGVTHVYHQYTIRVKGGRRDLPEKLAARGIGTSVYYPLPVHRQPVYLERGYGDLHLPWAERLAGEVLSIPVHPGVTEDGVARIVDALDASVGG